MILNVNLNPIAVQIGPIAIHWYALMYIIGILLGLLVLNSQKRYLNISYNDCLDWLNYAVFGLLIGGRLGYVIVYNLQHYLSNPIEILFVWKGGMAFHGGAIGACFGTFLFARSKNISFFKLLDILVLAVCPGLFFGRLGNFINAELIGKPTGKSWGIIFETIDLIPRHPSQLYEAFGEGLLLCAFLWIIFYFCQTKQGYLFSFFTIGYGIIRFSVEFFREPDAHIGYLYGSLSMGHYLSIVTVLLGTLVFLYLKYKKC